MICIDSFLYGVFACLVFICKVILVPALHSKVSCQLTSVCTCFRVCPLHIRWGGDLVFERILELFKLYC